jgi:hypothetical protein
VQRRGERTAQRLVGPGLELAGAPAAADGRRPHRIEQHGLPHAPQPGQDDAALRTPSGHALEQDVEGLQLVVAPRQLRRALPGAGSVRIPHGIHARTVSRCLALTADTARKTQRRVAVDIEPVLGWHCDSAPLVRRVAPEPFDVSPWRRSDLPLTVALMQSRIIMSRIMTQSRS